MKKNFVRILALILALLMMTMSLASCGGKKDEEPSPTPEAPSEIPTPTPEPVYVTEYIGTVTDVSSFLNVRSGPSTSAEKIGEAKVGEKFTVLEQNVDGTVWHKISFNGMEGYVSGDYLTINEVITEIPQG